MSAISRMRLKTPLSVMVNEAAARRHDPLAQKVREQTDIMRDQVARQLERARLAARSTVVGTVTDVPPVVTALARTMEKIHRDRDIAIDARCAGARALSRRAAGPRGDGRQSGRQRLQMGAVARRHRGRRQRARRATASGRVRIIVDDDGPGLSPAEREQVARRGRRLDETKPGSGLGLSIVVELAGLYGGALTLGTAPIGGLRAELVLPAG